ncbi:hypothetical protein H0H87_005508 [Tephrocybe sp. NHM501043]|nr:hypothetical protein H0H87_005508 [Tephrocybe sp. NHM501043]
MEDRRAQTLEALETFINAQKALLARTHSDITRLRTLKSDAIARPTTSLLSLEQEVNPKALQNLNIDLHQKRDARDRPSLHQHSELSPLQKLVKDARCAIVDPVLAIYECMSEPEDEPQEKLDPEEVRRRLEKEKLRELKKRKIHAYGGLSLPSRGVLGVYVRHDVEDESPDVDITLDDEPGSSMNVDTPPSSTPSVPPHPTKRLPMLPIAREARSEKKSKPQKRKAKSPPVERGSSQDFETTAPSKPQRGKDKPKPETYKQQWSVSEQHLLEQLLDQIPEGEKNRYVDVFL